MSIKVHKGSAPYLFMAQGTNFGTFLTLCQKFAKIKSKVEPADISWNTRTRSVHSCNILLFALRLLQKSIGQRALEIIQTQRHVQV